MTYDWLRALHVLSIISWMAGMLYLPRLFVYHVKAKPGSELSETLKIMERRLLLYIIGPAMVASYVFGIWMLVQNSSLLQEPYMYAKFAGVFGLQIVYVMLVRYRRAFADDRNNHSELFFRVLNEVPTLFMILIVIMALVRPWALTPHY